MNLKHIADQVLLSDTKLLVGRERELSLKVLHHLKEIERRRLFSDLKFGSLFEYAVRELGYSEPSAARRIQSARLLEDFPELEKKIENGSLTLTNMAMAAQAFKNQNITDDVLKKEILSQIENTSKRGCEKKLLEYATVEPLPPERIRVSGPNFYSVRWNISEKTMELFEELKGLLAHKRLTQDEILSMAISVTSEKIRKEKFKLQSRATTPVAKPCVKRYVPASIKKEVYKRDSGRCTMCRGTYKLEYDHILPFSMGGETTVENLRLRCFSCNQRRNKS